MRYLTFDLSDSSDAILTLEAMASTREAEHAAVMAEVAQLLAWAQAEFGGRQGPVEDGHAWDHELLVQHETGGWVTVTLTFSASAEFAEAFQAAFLTLLPRPASQRTRDLASSSLNVTPPPASPA